MNKRYSTTVAALAAVTIMATGTIAPLLGQTPQTASAQPPPNISIHTKVVRDDPAGNAVGWNPDNLTRSFNITDLECCARGSTILINTHQLNFVVCSVDYRPNNIQFEVNCIETTPGYKPLPGQMPVLEGGPTDGAILYYTVIYAPIAPLTVPPADVLEQTQNATAERREGAGEGEEAAE
jgi:hypothetical protein